MTFTLKSKKHGSHQFYIDAADADLYLLHRWTVWQIGNNYYAVTNVKQSNGKQKREYLHRMIMPGVPRVDHKDGNGLNCRQSNLRSCTASQNCSNQSGHKRRKCKYKGVSESQHSTKKYKAQISFNRKSYDLGNYATQEEAAKAYNRKALELHGDFARLNVLPPLAGHGLGNSAVSN